MRWSRSRAWLALAMLIAPLVGCGSVETRDRSTPPLVYPAPPAPARFELEPPIVALEIPAGFFGRIGRAILGTPHALRLDRPTGLDWTDDGELAFVDQGVNRVYVCSIEGRISRELDLGAAGIEEAVDVVSTLDGALFVSDPRRGRVVRFAAGSDGTDARDVEAFATGGRPTSLALSSDGAAILIVDTTTPAILSLDLATGRIDERAPAVAARAALNRPVWITASAAGGAWIVDALNFRVCHLAADGEWTGCFGQLGDGPGSFARPRGIAIDEGGRVYVVDGLFGNCQVFDPRGRLLLAFGAAGSGYGEMVLPSDIAIDGDRIAITDSYNRRIQIFRRLPPPAGERSEARREESMP